MTRSPVRGRFFLLAYLASCLEPTEVNLVLTTDVCELRHVSVYLGDATEPVATLDRQPSASCDALGNLVFIPSKRGDRFQVRVEGTIRADNVCGPLGCVRVSRSVGFVSHAKLQLPISIERSCLDVMCPKGTTCRQGGCIDDTVDCRMDNTCKQDAGPDSGPIDSGADSGVCAKPGSRVAMGTEIVHFTFDDSDPSTTTDSKKGIKVPLTQGFKRTAHPLCNQALILGGTADLDFKTTTIPGIAMSFELFIPSTAVLPVGILRGTGSSQATWSIYVAGAPPTLGVEMGIVVSQTSTKTPIAKGVWHHVELFVTPTPSIELAIDDKPIETLMPTNNVGAPPGLEMFAVGSSNLIQIDELGIFDGMLGN